MKSAWALPIGFAVVAMGCGGATNDGTSTTGTGDKTPDASSAGGAQADAAAGSGGMAGGGAAGGCQDGSAGTSGSSTMRVPKNHRAAGTACPEERAPVNAEARCSCPDSGFCECGECTKDSDCTQGKNGRCEARGPIAYLQCTYDECFADSDCPSRVPCQCRDSSMGGTANTCVTSGNCGVDADCGPNGYCSPSVLEFCSCFSTALCGDAATCYAGNTKVPCSCGDSCGHGYFCHTRNDACIDDSDCCGQGTCNYDNLAARWDCSECWPIP